MANETESGRVITGDGAEPSDRRKVLCEEGGASVETSGVSSSGKAAVEESAASSAGGQVASKQPGKSVAPVCTSGSGSNGGDHPVFALVDKVLEGGEHPMLIESMAKLLKAKTEMLAAQAQATVARGSPLCLAFRARTSSPRMIGLSAELSPLRSEHPLAGWSKDQRLYQLKVHLERTALQVFCVMPEQERKDYDTAVKKLKERFQPVDIAELKGIEFHQRMQLPEEPVEQWGMAFQNLARKAFPQAKGREFDWFLKGRFFQALHTKWQRKLGAPKTDESFSELMTERGRWRGMTSSTLQWQPPDLSQNPLLSMIPQPGKS